MHSIAALAVLFAPLQAELDASTTPFRAPGVPFPGIPFPGVAALDPDARGAVVWPFQTAKDAPAAGLGVKVGGVAPQVVEDPFGFGFDTIGVVTRLPDGGRAAFDGRVVRRYTQAGQFVEVLAELPAHTFAAFLRVCPAGDALLLGESSHGELWRVELDGSGAAPVADLELPYDAAFLDEDPVVVNGAGCTGCDASVRRLALSGGGATTVLQLTGPSGPVAGDGAGGFYVVDIGRSGGSARILHFPAELFDGPLPVDEAELDVVSAGYVGVSSLAHDAQLDRLYVAENDLFSGVSVVKVAGGDAPSDEVVLDGVDFRWLSDLQVLPRPENGAFHPYQPPSAGVLEVSSTNFAVDDTDRLTVRGVRPRAEFEGPGVGGSGAVTLRLEGAPPLGTAMLLAAPASAVVDEYVLDVAGSLPWALSLAPANLEMTDVVLALDSAGEGEQSFVHRAGTDVLAVQLVCLRPDGTVVGTSTLAVL